MRLLAGILVTAVLSRTGFADSVHPVRTLSAGLSFSGYAGATNGVPTNGVGPTAEVALGFGRTQLFLEGGPAWLKLGVLEPREDAFVVRGALGARWIARSFEFDNAGAVEMTLDALAGANKISRGADDRVVRPELALGVALQMRKFRNPHMSVHFRIRLYFTPTDDNAMTTARCTGGCESMSSFTDGGMMFSIGGGL